MKEYLLSFSDAKDMEDIVLYHVLKEEPEIFWIDVGSYDPVMRSVTKFFSVRGGHGINIEPQQAYIQKYKEDRPNDINLNIGISDMAGELTLYGKNTLATFDKSNKNVTDPSSAYTVPVRTLKDVCNQYVKENDTIHFLKIDVEGWEKQCIAGMDFEKYRPWILCIEAIDPSTYISDHEKWEDILLENGYVFAGTKNRNRYYVLSEKTEIIERLKNDISCLEKYYDVVFYYEYRKFYPAVQKIKRNKILSRLILPFWRYYRRQHNRLELIR